MLSSLGNYPKAAADFRATSAPATAESGVTDDRFNVGWTNGRQHRPSLQLDELGLADLSDRRVNRHRKLRTKGA
jgi:hypothetical protein